MLYANNQQLEQLYDFILEHIMTEHGGKVIGRDVSIEDIKTSLPVSIDTDSESEDDDVSVASTEDFSDEELDTIDEEPTITMTQTAYDQLIATHYQRGYDEGIKDKRKQKKPKKEKILRENYAKPNAPSSIDGIKVKNLSSFKFCGADIESEDPVSIRFNHRDGKICEYCPAYSYRENPDVKKYLLESKAYQKSNVWSNSTKTLPKNWGLVENEDYFMYDTNEDRPTRQINRIWTF